MIRKRITTAFFLMVALLTGAFSVQAQSVEEFYSHNNLTFVVSASPGGGADIYARTFVPFLKKHMPGHPNIIVTNLPGASGLKAATVVQKSTDPDGLTITLLQSNNLYVPAVKRVPFDPREVDWIGSIAREKHVLVTWHTSGLKSFEDLLNAKRKIKIGATTINQINGTLPYLMQQALPNTPIDLIKGFKGTPEILLSMQRGEVDARSQSITSLFGGSEHAYFKSGELIPLVQLTRKNSDALPNVPGIMEYIKDPKWEAFFDFFLTPVAASRPVAVPKGVPADRLNALRQAFNAAVRDPDFNAALARMQNDAELLTGEEVAEIVNKVYATPKDVLQFIKDILN